MSLSSPSAVLLDDTHYDVLLLGTGLSNCILAAALAKAGKKVLHIDSNDHYGSNDTSAALHDFIASLQSTRHTQTADEATMAEWRRLCDDGAACRYRFAPVQRFSPFHAFTASAALPPPVSRTAAPAAGPSSSPAVVSEASADAAVSAAADAALSNEAVLSAAAPSSSSDVATAAEAPSPPPPPTAAAAASPSPLASLSAQSRLFSIDHTPHLILSRSALVELLIASNVAAYLDFKAVDASFLCQSEDGLQRVPVSRSDVFVSELIAVTEKRQLMRLLQSVAPNSKLTPEQEERDRKDLQMWADRPFADWLASRDVSSRLASFVAYAIALLDYRQLPSSSSSSSSFSSPVVSTADGVALMRTHFLSIGRYGSGAFLYPIYGMGELPQAFARLCAVHSGTYILRFPPQALVLQRDADGRQSVAGVVTEGRQFITADAVVCEREYVEAAEEEEEEKQGDVSCGLCILDAPLLDGRGRRVAELVHCVFPPGVLRNEHAVRLLQLGDAVKISPAPLCLLHLYTPAAAALPQDDLQPVIDFLTESDSSSQRESEQPSKPRLLWSAFYRRKQRAAVFPSSAASSSTSTSSSSLLSGSVFNLYVPSVSSPLQSLDLHVEEAAVMLSAICPGVELLSALMARRRDGLLDDEKELDPHSLSAVLDVDEHKEEEKGDAQPVQPATAAAAAAAARDVTEDGDDAQRGGQQEAEEEKKQTMSVQQPTASSAPLTAQDEVAILDSLDSLTFD